MQTQNAQSSTQNMLAQYAKIQDALRAYCIAANANSNADNDATQIAHMEAHFALVQALFGESENWSNENFEPLFGKNWETVGVQVGALKFTLARS